MNWRDCCRGCTGVPDGPFHDCCVAHDWDYELKKRTRKESDLLFLACMLDKGKWKPMAYIYYYGVRLFGRFFW